jgi:hypothetical protein
MMSVSMKSLCAWLMLAAVAVAQPPQRQPGGGGRGGFGGPGGMGGAVGLVGMPEVKKELALTEAQDKSITELGEKLREDARSGGGGFNREALQNASEEERQKMMTEMRAKMEETAKKADAQLMALLDATQQKRLSELRLQREGITAIARDEVADKLKLTDEQKETVAGIQAQAREAMGALGGGRGGPGAGGGRPQPGAGGPGGVGGDFRAAMEKAQKAREQQQTDLLAVLTTEQKATWETMLGKKFEFPQQRGFGGGAGGPGGNRPAGGQRPPTE